MFQCSLRDFIERDARGSFNRQPEMLANVPRNRLAFSVSISPE
jgi:hypothetical protein